MSSATLDAPKTSKSAAGAQRVRLSVPGSQQSTEDAVAQLVHGGVATVRSLVPAAVLRPTQTVELAFDVAEQLLVAFRRFALEVATAVEAATEESGRRERHEERVA